MRLHLRRFLLWLVGAVLVGLVFFHSFIHFNFSEIGHHGQAEVQVEFDRLDPVKRRHQHKGPREFHAGQELDHDEPMIGGWPHYALYQHNKSKSTWPAEYGERDDRIINQLTMVLPDKSLVFGSRLKTILVYYGLEHGMKPGQSRFIEHECPINQCMLTDNPTTAPRADLILFKDIVTPPGGLRPPNQVWALFMLESPMHTSGFAGSAGINWTATYRRDSTIVAPYERFSQYANITEANYPKKPSRNYAAGKSKLVAWFVSNCYAANGRGYYTDELQKHIQVDIYGACGNLRCSRGTGTESDPCSVMLKNEYKFYLSFENSNCRDYITEKFYMNALNNDVIPIVMGAPRADYERAAPLKSFIHVDDFESPKHLAEYLKKVAADDELYNSYFLWKGTGQYIDTKFWCRLCAMLHQTNVERRHSEVTNLEEWWRGEGVCVVPPDPNTYASWRNTTYGRGAVGLSNSYKYAFDSDNNVDKKVKRNRINKPTR